MFARRGGAAGWLAFPYLVIFECCGPLIEVIGYLFMALAFCLDLVSSVALVAFLLMAIGFGLLNSVAALLLEEISFHLYPHPKHLLLLVCVAVAENFGYRQLNSMWRLTGLLNWVFKQQANWGDMTRKASLHSADRKAIRNHITNPSKTEPTDS